MNTVQSSPFADLARQLEGEIESGDTIRHLYATDASAYREMPEAVAFPRSTEDIRTLVRFAADTGRTLIPRTAGTSLAGQVVGSGLVVDVSRHLGRILEIDPEKRLATVQPGVVRDELNRELKPHGLLFGPETSTSNRAMLGGMVGNNSCGSNFLVYGNTRERLVRVKAILADGSEAVFKSLTPEAFSEKCALSTLEGAIYRQARDLLAQPGVREEIEHQFPKPNIRRRNTGYALDQLMACQPFAPEGPDFNFCRLVAGSEGTLCFITEITVSLDPLPDQHTALLCAHFETVIESLRANLIGLRHGARACELIDRVILDCTKTNIAQRKNRFFIEGDPGAILVVEIGGATEAERDARVQAVIADMKAAGLGYHFPVLIGEDMPRIWELRKAGQGLLSNVPGAAKPVEVIEDTAVDPEDLPAYIEDYDRILAELGLESVYYAHAGSGELHLRPMIDLKTAEGQKQFREIAEKVAVLVKKYRGSLSGEHGDGRLRAEFIPTVMGERVMGWFIELKAAWDPQNVFNRGKIVDAPPMDTHLRHEADPQEPEFDTLFDWSATRGFLQAAEMCSGSGDCRKSALAGGTMCPSYQATRHEKDTTRARANILREMITHSGKANPLDSPEILDVMDLCLSCKGCKAECPSNVDVTRLKAEFLQHYHDANGASFRTRFFADFEKNQRRAARMAPVANFMTSAPGLSTLLKKALGIHPRRSIPRVAGTPLRRWVGQNPTALKPAIPNGRRVIFFIDEFTNYLDCEIGIHAIQLLTGLGYAVECPPHPESGRAALSKGMVRMAREKIEQNVSLLAPLVNADTPLVGLEPSAILTFRDEAPDLVRDSLREQARQLAPHALMLDEFLAAEAADGRIGPENFSDRPRKILLHGHCHQKALASVQSTRTILELPRRHTVEVIPSGCCGMAGSFGYEREHFDLSMQIGNLVLFPAIEKADEETWIAAPGTSCRHQIFDGTGRPARHPAEILNQALRRD